ncbi:MAG: hypothetical protein J2P48_18275 [Alphaproteobacteria bacterium]|nr:hypothetical protein [Alphaproteobacteria bacterium]
MARSDWREVEAIGLDDTAIRVATITFTGSSYKTAIAANIVDIAVPPEERPGAGIRLAVLKAHWRAGNVW